MTSFYASRIGAGAKRWRIARYWSAAAWALLTQLAPSPLALAADGPAVRQSAAVKLSNRVVIKLHGPIAGYSAEDRAQGAMERVLDSDPDAQVTVEDAEEGRAVRVLLGGRHVFLVAPIDVDPHSGETPEIVAREAVNRLKLSIEEWREHKTPHYLAKAAALAAATAFFAAILWLTEGTVMELGMFVTRIRTGFGEGITLPNSGVMATNSRNYSRAVPGTGYVVDTTVTVGYSTPWRLRTA